MNPDDQPSPRAAEQLSQPVASSTLAPLGAKSVGVELLETAKRLGWRAVVGICCVPLGLMGVAFTVGFKMGAPPPLEALPTAVSLVPTSVPQQHSEPGQAHIDGAINRPGVYEFGAGWRVADLVLAAGGLTADADTARINLARALTDGERVVVPREGQPLPAEADGTGAGDGATSGPININTASVAALQQLPGIGPALATEIDRSRTAQGPFRSVNDLTRVSGIGDATVARLAPHATT